MPAMVKEVHPDIERVLYSTEEIREKTAELGARITADYPKAGVGETPPLLAVGVLTGCFVFYADLVREIKLPVQIDFVQCSSYGASATSSGEIRMKKEMSVDPAGRDILVVEDIVDTGLTLQTLCELLISRGARSVKICTLLDKACRRTAPRVGGFMEYTGFECADEFVVGYGIDYAEKYRNLPFVGALKRSVYEKPAEKKRKIES